MELLDDGTYDESLLSEVVSLLYRVVIMKESHIFTYIDVWREIIEDVKKS